jgi:hypothetical protein
MRLRWLVPIAILYSLRMLAAESAVKPRIATITISPSEVTTLHLRPEFESTIHMPEEITSVNTGKNFLIKAASGVGSLAAMLVGNNSGAAFSEGDLMRQRVAENVGNTGDSELMSLNATSRIIVSVPADTKIYIVFTKHEESQTGLHRVAGQ